MDELEARRIARSTTTLANAGELVAQLVTEIAGNDISNSLGGERITMDAIAMMAQRRMIGNLLNGVAK